MKNEYLYKMNDENRTISCNAPSGGVRSWCRGSSASKRHGDSGENSCIALPGREAERRDYNQSCFTEAAPKYDEMIYYFLKAGYHVYMPEHMGHGQSYRLTADPSLVHIDTWKRYVRDFLKICHVIKKTYPELPLVLFAHSMGGAIGTIAAAWEPQLFQKIILNSPMLRPLTGNVPWPLVIAIAQTKCLLGKKEDYVAGQKPYDGSETFETSGCTSRPRFEKYNELRKENKKFQVSAASYGWLLASVKMSWYIKYCGWKKLSAPVLLFQAEKDDFVSVNALRKFAEKINHRGITSCEYVYLPGTRHETYCSDDRTMEMYLDKIMKFLDSCSGEMFSHYEVLRE